MPFSAARGRGAADDHVFRVLFADQACQFRFGFGGGKALKALRMFKDFAYLVVLRLRDQYRYHESAPDVSVIPYMRTGKKQIRSPEREKLSVFSGSSLDIPVVLLYN